MTRLLLVILFLFVGQLQAEEVNIRLLAIKHSKEHMADGDADMAIAAAKSAANKGLAISTIGNEFLGRDGILRASVYSIDFNYKIDAFKRFLDKHMKIDAKEGDTLILFTIGHGFPNGSLQNLGQRSDVMKAIAEVAEDNHQKVLWWQLSCHAAAGLPSVSSLPETQRGLLSVLATSTAQETSAAYVQGKVMEQVFNAIATNSKNINPDGDESISGTELKNFLNSNGSRRGDLLYTLDYNEPIFGQEISLANRIPVIDRNGSQGKYPKNYIPRPQR